jgi:predicted heme/steroid binding protein
MTTPRSVYALTLLVGALGVFLAVWPTADLFGACPAVVRTWRSSLWSALGWSPSPSPAGSALDPSTGLPVYTAADLSRYNGQDESLPILLGMAGDVYDVTEKGRQFYGKGAPYNVFAGRDSTRALTLGTLDGDDVERAGDTSDFTPQQLGMLDEQKKFYAEKYPRVGVLAGRGDSKGAAEAAPAATAAAEAADAAATEAPAETAGQ